MAKNREFPGKRDPGNSREQALFITGWLEGVTLLMVTKGFGIVVTDGFRVLVTFYLNYTLELW